MPPNNETRPPSMTTVLRRLQRVQNFHWRTVVVRQKYNMVMVITNLRRRVSV